MPALLCRQIEEREDKLASEGVATMRAKGTFEVKLTPQSVEGNPEDPPLGRMSIDKHYQGDLEGTAYGQMLTAGTGTQGSGGYVAVERVIGKLHDRSGSFVLQHSGTMTRGNPNLMIAVVPDSGTGELTGLRGRLAIEITDGKHYYDFEYALADEL